MRPAWDIVPDMNIKYAINRTLLSLLVLLAPAAALAAERWYRIEMIIFDYPTSSHSLKTEKWPDSPGAPDTQDALTLRAPSGKAAPIKPRPMQMLPENRLKLASVIKSLSNSRDFRILFHAAWVQPVYRKNRSKPLHLQAGRKLTIEIPAVQPPASPASPDNKPATAPATKPDTAATGKPGPAVTPAGTAPTPVPLVRKTVYPLDGLITISRGRYLHVWIDMLYTQVRKFSENPATPEKDKAFFYRNTQHRRVKRKELHFIDHPAFGILIRITRFKLPAVKTGQ